MTDEQAPAGDEAALTTDEPASTPDEPAPLTDPSLPAYKGAPLDPERGPGLGCFWVQTVTFLVLFVLTPFGVINGWPAWLTTTMFIVTLVLLLFVGQTVIFLLRLVAADRRTRRRPLREGARPTVGDLSMARRGGHERAEGDTPLPAADADEPADAADAAQAEAREGGGPPAVRQ